MKVDTKLNKIVPVHNKIFLSLYSDELLLPSITIDAPVDVAANARGITAKHGGQKSSFVSSVVLFCLFIIIYLL